MTTYIRIFVLISIGVAAGVYYASTKFAPTEARKSDNAITYSSPTSETLTATYDASKLTDFENELASLKDRIAVLEANSTFTETLIDIAGNTDSSTLTVARNTPLPVIEGLVAAGVDAYTAEEIARAQSSIQLKRLELRDTAIREGYLGTDRFREELQQLRDSEVAIRDQVSEENYDRYLYHTGQPNRLVVDSVILGSTAEEVGIQQGDVILSYEEQRLFDWNDLRDATSAGERGELVSVRVYRNGSEQMMTLPRGPLGVRLNAIRQHP